MPEPHLKYFSFGRKIHLPKPLQKFSYAVKSEFANLCLQSRVRHLQGIFLFYSDGPDGSKFLPYLLSSLFLRFNSSLHIDHFFNFSTIPFFPLPPSKIDVRII